LVGGLLAGLAAGLVHPILAAQFPLVQTDVLVPLEPLNRLAWIGTFAVLLGLIIPGIKPPRAATPTAEEPTARVPANGSAEKT
jgi:hypothetical protein